MQYQSALNREQLTELAIHSYFGNVDKKNLDDVVDCFHDNAMITVQTAFTTHAGKDEIRRMFIDFMGAYKTIIHKDFTCTVDENNSRITASFTAELEDDDGPWPKLPPSHFWRIRGDKFQEVYIYMSGENPLV